MAPRRVITVSVLTVESTDCFYVLDEELATLEDDFQREIQKIAEKQPKPKAVKVNRVYFAKKQGRWYRAKVTAVTSDSKCEVQLIDYGRTTVVCDSDFHNISENNFLAELEPKTMKCVLDIPPDHPINKFPCRDDAFKYMVSDRQKFNLHISRFDEDTLVVDLVTTGRIRNFSVIEFLACVICVSPPPCAAPPAAPEEGLMIRKQKFESPAEIEVVSIVSPSEFHFALANLKADWFVMSLEMQEFYRTNRVKFVLLVPGVFCVTEDNENHWWRVQVLKAPNSEGWCKVHFIDNGNIELVMWHGLYELDEQFYDFPRYSTACSLKDVEPPTERWMPASTNCFRKCVLNVDYKVEVVIDAGSEAGILHIFPNGLKINVNRVMVAFRFAYPAQNASFGPILEADPDVQEEGVSKKLHQIELVNPKSFNPTEFHVKFFEFKKAFSSLEDFLQTRAIVPKGRQWKVDDKCLVFCSLKKSEKRYLRGVINELKDSGTRAVITLSDYGSMLQIEAPTKKLAVGPQLLEDLGSSVIPVQLACDTMAEWTTEERHAVTTLLTNFHRLYITFKDNNAVMYSTSQKPRPVILWGQQETGVRQNIITVLEQMNLSVKSRFAEKSELQLERKDWSVLDFIKEAKQLSDCNLSRFNISDDKTTALIGKFNVSLKKRIVDSWLPAMPIDKRTFIAVGSYVDNDGNVVVHDIFLDNTLKELNELINHFFRGIPDTRHQFKVGDPCLVLYESDALYYRGKIIQMNGNKCDVEFIDYGNTQRGVETCRLFEKVIGAEVPAFAVRYRLRGSPFKAVGSTEWQVKLHAHVVDRNIEIKVLPQDLDCPGIKRCQIKAAGITVKCYEDVDAAVISVEDPIET